MADEVEIQLPDVQLKLGGLMLQIMGYERRIAEQDQLIAELRARESEKGPAPVADFPRGVPDAETRADLLGSA